MVLRTFTVLSLCLIVLFSCNKSKDNELLLSDVKNLVKYDSVAFTSADSSGVITQEIFIKGGPNLNNPSVFLNDLSSIAALLYFQKNESTIKEKFDFVTIKFQRDTGKGKYIEFKKFSKNNLKLASQHIDEITNFNDSYVAKDYNKMYSFISNDLKMNLKSSDVLKNEFVKIDSSFGEPQNAIVFGFEIVKAKSQIDDKEEKLIVYKTEVKRGEINTMYFTYVKPNELTKNNIIGFRF